MSLVAIDPRTGETVREVASATDAEVDAILEAARAAFGPWRALGFDARAARLREVATILRAEADALGAVMTEEMGKPAREARGEVLKSAWCAEHYAEHAATYLAPEEVASDATRSWVQYPPLGPVLGILPWNAPFWLAWRFAAPALMAGNPCVMKPDPHVPGCGAAIEDVFRRAGLPAGVFASLLIETERVEAVIRDPRIRAVSFTGSERGGAVVASVAASEIKPAVLELGGSDPAIVLADADLDAAVDAIALMRIINAGQSCIAAKRVLVERPVYEDFVGRLAAKLGALSVGDPRLETTDLGPLARSDLRDDLHRQVRASIDAGATCVMGGEIPDGAGFFYPVTLLRDVPRDAAAMREETFGPVAAVTPVEDLEDAIALANDTAYGLGASLFTGRDADALAARIEAGQVAINGVVKTDPRLPSGGIKRSGYGRELGRDGIRMFVNAQQVWVGPKRG